MALRCNALHGVRRARLIVADVGLYAVLAFDTSQRTREIGVRTALGAGRASIIRLVLVRALSSAGAGIALGAAAAALLAPHLRDPRQEFP